jgi:hypothetical protein
MKLMKTTIDIPDATLRRAKSIAAEKGITLRQFVTEAVEEKLKNFAPAEEKPWMKHFGKLAHLHEETAEIDRFIEEVFENIDPEMWAPESKD